MNIQTIDPQDPYSPISLKDFLDKAGPDLKRLTLLVDGTGNGIYNDAGIVNIAPADCKMQAEYYKTIHNVNQFPMYLLRYLYYLFLEEDYKIKSNEEVAKIYTEDETVKQRLNSLVLNCDKNPEAAQCIGLVQLIAGTLSMARRQKAGVRVYIEHPETHLHPKRQSKFTSVLTDIYDEYTKPIITNVEVPKI